MLRICPNCEYQGDEKVCPFDGFPMVSAAEYGDGTSHPLIGRVFEERYEIEELLGKGGMGWVFQARHRKTGQKVALKVMRKGDESDLARVKRFYAEARMSSQLTQPHTVRVFDFGSSDDGYLYMSMELLSGQSMADLVTDSAPLEPRRVAKIVQQICFALQEAHALGLIHRDLKPENIFLCEVHSDPEFVKVVDFGVAKALEANADDELSRITRTGTTVGTPAYMAPEQAILDEMDGRTDLYALGVLAYEALSGKVPFEYDSAFKMLMAHIEEELPPLPDEVKGVPLPIELRTLVEEMLAKNKEARPDTAQEIAERLEPYVAGHGPVAYSTDPDRVAPARSLPKPRRSSPKRQIVMNYVLPGLTFLLLVTFGIWIILGPGASKRAKRVNDGNSPADRPTLVVGAIKDAGTAPVPMDAGAFEPPTLLDLARENPRAFDRTIYLRRIDQKKGGFLHCAKRYLSKVPTGKTVPMGLSFTVGPAGKVTSVKLAPSPLHTPEFVACIRRLIGSIKFPASRAKISMNVPASLLMTR
jgi:serine/threonine-protein kinase